MRKALLLSLWLWTACCPGARTTVQPVSAAAPAPVPSAPAPQPTAEPTQDPVVAKATELVQAAAKIEPEVTVALKNLASAQNGEMVKLEYRLKTQASTERKIRMMLDSYPELTIAAVRIDDALRYTMRVDDDPPGRYMAAAKTTLADLEASGHVVEYVKNYWPKDDNYSGINSVLRHRSGLLWELQFHTGESFAAQSDTRAGYEEMRKVNTPLERKRELFDAMTARWNKVAIPKGALEKGALHSRDQVRDRPRP